MNRTIGNISNDIIILNDRRWASLSFFSFIVNGRVIYIIHHSLLSLWFNSKFSKFALPPKKLPDFFYLLNRRAAMTSLLKIGRNSHIQILRFKGQLMSTKHHARSTSDEKLLNKEKLWGHWTILNYNVSSVPPEIRSLTFNWTLSLSEKSHREPQLTRSYN